MIPLWLALFWGVVLSVITLMVFLAFTDKGQ